MGKARTRKTTMCHSQSFVNKVSNTYRGGGSDDGSCRTSTVVPGTGRPVVSTRYAHSASRRRASSGSWTSLRWPRVIDRRGRRRRCRRDALTSPCEPPRGVTVRGRERWSGTSSHSMTEGGSKSYVCTLLSSEAGRSVGIHGRRLTL